MQFHVPLDPPLRRNGGPDERRNGREAPAVREPWAGAASWISGQPFGPYVTASKPSSTSVPGISSGKVKPGMKAMRTLALGSREMS